ncbi:MAG: sugar ABC transporter permease [Sphaerochaeta sp.]|jgi:multiple sugar transport system permease protein|uniref:carbohydrate ABC transporter permease n=1 Tax=unclassified Sphaerochaeta TaxID=2637943 RepID=UPI000A8CF7C9|nr:MULTISPECIES: sugar ABC transporter permease [unclassified Sphaerochaeta]MCK9602184.1 sugar ABC transporter permease [Sphaerochaeta sp.]MDX9824416.1 sugar ABC transporter permease [Sphaerochaeta sp.]MEA4864394.1 sugar ABC transporter permease [Sphaerochaeta sp.]HCU30053.1 sugar ABC transporter permease [Sphaerochaeta sp.]HPE93284.1 sugar ABC transporter permease [Sphaerochaeta sp.]
MVRQGFFEKNLRYIFPLPAVLFVVVLMVFPVAYTFFLSFTDWTLTSGRPLSVVGLNSYLQVLKEPRFLEALGRTFYFTFGSVIVEMLLGTALALILNRSFKGKGVVKTLLLLPLVATPVAIGIVWNLFYDPTIGILNYVLSVLKLPQSGWVSDAKTVMPSLIIVDIWQWTPMITIIVLAGLAGLSSEPYESAMVDGANSRQVLFRITLPMLMPTILTAVILRAIDALKTYDIIYSMTGGGPGYASENLNVLAFKYSFEYFRMGQSAVMLVFLFIIVLLFSLLVMRLRRAFEL